jgi:cell division protein FtsQ
MYGGQIRLPATDLEAALMQLDLLDQRDRLLDLGFAQIDLRVPGQLAVRRPGATA